MPKKNLNAKAIRTIRKMIDNILANPSQVDQDNFPEPNVCETAFCAAGHLVLARSPKRFKNLMSLIQEGKRVSWVKEAAEAIDLTKSFNHNFSISPIFGATGEWPSKYREMYRKANYLITPKARNRARAKAFAARWEALIASDAKELYS